MTDAPATPADKLRQAAEIGQEAGLHFTYAGNLPGRVDTLEDTFCPACQTRLIQRQGYTLLDYRITRRRRLPQLRRQNPRRLALPARNGAPGRLGHAAPVALARLSALTWPTGAVQGLLLYLKRGPRPAPPWPYW